LRRQAGPLPSDVQETLSRQETEGTTGTEEAAKELNNQAVGLEGAEISARRRLEKIQEQRARQAARQPIPKAKAAAKAKATPEHRPPRRERPPAARRARSQNPEYFDMAGADFTSVDPEDVTMPDRERVIYNKRKKIVLRLAAREESDGP